MSFAPPVKTLLVEESPVGESQSNGTTERRNLTVEGQIRATDALETQVWNKTTADHRAEFVGGTCSSPREQTRGWSRRERTSRGKPVAVVRGALAPSETPGGRKAVEVGRKLGRTACSWASGRSQEKPSSATSKGVMMPASERWSL